MISRESWYKEADAAQLQRALEQWKRGQMELIELARLYERHGADLSDTLSYEEISGLGEELFPEVEVITNFLNTAMSEDEFDLTYLPNPERYFAELDSSATEGAVPLSKALEQMLRLRPPGRAHGEFWQGAEEDMPARKVIRIEPPAPWEPNTLEIDAESIWVEIPDPTLRKLFMSWVQQAG